MDLLFARQPILDKNNKIYGYELLYRDVGANTYTGSDGDFATSNVIAASFLSLDLDEISGSKKSFINFTENMVLQKVATLFPKEKIVVEILEDVDPTEEIVTACENLKNEGYIIALDDFVFRPGYEALIDIADIIKVDFMITKTKEERIEVVKKFRNGKIKFLAEKVETHNDFEMAVKNGYSLFQGYYFSKPVIKKTKSISPGKLSYMKLVRYLEQTTPEFSVISDIIENDVAFTYEILRIANTSHYYRRSRVSSVRQAAVLIGLDELKKWAFITMFRKISAQTNDALVNLSVQRAKTLEILAEKLGFHNEALDFFTLGMLSLIDVLTGEPMDKLLTELPLHEKAKKILLGEDINDIMAISFKFVLAYEKGEWEKLFEYAEKYPINIEKVGETYHEAFAWINKNDFI